jgi:hypothetical protein
VPGDAIIVAAIVVIICRSKMANNFTQYIAFGGGKGVVAVAGDILSVGQDIPCHELGSKIAIELEEMVSENRRN